MSGHSLVSTIIVVPVGYLFTLLFPLFARKFQTKCHFKSTTLVQLPKEILSKAGVVAQPELLNVH